LSIAITTFLHLANGCLQQIAANRFSIPQDVIAILLQGFVSPLLPYAQGRHQQRWPARSAREPVNFPFAASF
jgi:hypothetical protein